MQSSQAFLNGRWVERSELTVPISDAGFVLGTTVTEQLRTFSGQLFRLDEHLERLFHSLDILRIDPGHTRRQLAEITLEVVDRNHPQLAAGDDLGIGMFVTPGGYPLLTGEASTKPTVCVYPYLLPFGMWADLFETGQPLIVSKITQTPTSCWPAELKCRSRMHYYLADQAAREIDPHARALLLDVEGYVNEASTANVVMVRAGEGLVSPCRDLILPGISLGVLAELAARLDVPFVERAIRPEELRTADELLLTSTSTCVLPAVSVDGQAIGILGENGASAAAGQPGPVYRRLLDAWSDHVGLDIAAQARRFADRPVL